MSSKLRFWLVFACILSVLGLTSSAALAGSYLLNASPTSLTIGQGESGSGLISITTLLPNSILQVQLTLSTMPTGVTATLSSSTVTSASPATLTFNVSPTAPLVSTPITITADGNEETVTIQLTVSANRIPTTLTVTPSSAVIPLNSSQQFTATVLDQFGNPLTTQPSFTWSLATGGVGTISATGLYTSALNQGAAIVNTQADGLLGSAVVHANDTAPTVQTIASASPNPVTAKTTNLSVLGASDAGQSGLTYTWATTGTPPAPVAFSANGTNAAQNTVATFTQAGTYALQATIADAYGLSVTSSVTVVVNQTPTSLVVSPANVNLNLNGTQQFTAVVYDQFGNALATQPAITWSLINNSAGSVSSSGLYNAGPLTGGANVEATSGALVSSGNVNVSDAAPTVATAASASPNPVTGKTATLTALGASDEGANHLTYTWTTTGTPPAPVTFSATGTNAAQTTTATFSAAGTYDILVTITDTYLESVTSSVVVNVSQTPTVISVSPSTALLYLNATQQFTASATADQFGNPLGAQPTFTWSVASGVGSISASGLYSSGATPGSSTIQALVGSASGTATATVSDAAPTIATAAAASPTSVSGTTTNLSVLGASDAGQSSLTYTWATTGTPPAPVTYSVNGTNGAQNTVATFIKAGTYSFQVTIRDAFGQSVTSPTVIVTVNQIVNAIGVTPAVPTIVSGDSQQFVATAYDQFANVVAAQPTFTWTAAGGTISPNGVYIAGATPGTFTITAKAGTAAGTASATVTAALVSNEIYAINAGGGAASPFVADEFYNTGTEYSSTAAITTTGVSNPAPQAVYQTERYGNITYTLPGLTPGASYNLRLHFDELYWTAAGDRTFNVLVNGTQVLSNFDIYAAAGGKNIAIVESFAVTANGSGQVVIQFVSIINNAKVNGIELAQPLTPGFSISASPAAVSVNQGASGSTVVNLSIVNGFSSPVALTASGAPTGVTATFSPVSISGAATSTLTFNVSPITTAGTYPITITGTSGSLTSTATVTLTVVPNTILTSISVSPASSALSLNATQQFTAFAKDQFGNILTTQPTFAWSVLGGGVGSVSTSGLYSSGAAQGTATIQASAGTVTGTATATVTDSAPTIVTPATANPSPVTGTTTNLSVLGGSDAGQANLTYTWATTGTPPAAVTFSVNGTNAAQNTVATFTKVGLYSFQVTIKDAFGLSIASSVNVTVNSAPKTITVSPATVSLGVNAAQQFTASAIDQFNDTMTPNPTYTWSTVTTVGGTISSSGLFTSGLKSGTVAVEAASGAAVGTASVTVKNNPPTAAEEPKVVSYSNDLKTDRLTVLGQDDGGEGNLTYTWSCPGPSAVAFSPNGTNVSKNTTATFAGIGSYTLIVTITDAGGLTDQEQVIVNIAQLEESISISPSSGTLPTNSTLQFVGTSYDQFGNVMSPELPLSWSLGQGSIGSITASGLLTTGPTAGQVTVQAATGVGPPGSANINVIYSLDIAAASATPNPVTVGSPVTFKASGNGSSPDAESFTWSFGDGATAVQQNTTHTYSQVGIYPATVYLTDGTSTVSQTILVKVLPAAESGQDFYILAAPPDVNLAVGQNGSSTLQFVPINGFMGTINLSLSPAPGVWIYPTSVNVTSSTAPPTADVYLFSATPGTTTFTVYATSGGITHSVTISATAQ